MELMASAVGIEQQSKMVLKHNVVILIETQDELNQFAELEEVPEDALHVDEPYVAFRDDLGAIQVMPQKEIDDSYPQEFQKPTIFRKWYNKNKGK